MIAMAVAVGMESCSPPGWWQPGAMALLLVDLQQGSCGDAQPRPRPAFDQQFRAHTLPAAQVIPELAPRADELVLPKSSSSPFSSTTLDDLLRNIGIRTLVVIDLLTDQCIDHTVKDAADRGYRVVCLHDACQAETPERHGAALACFRGYCTQIPVAGFTATVEAVMASAQ
jgi:nicotinamidase-related amidase